MDQEQLVKIYAFLEGIERTNEDTEYDSTQDYLVESIIALVKEKGKTSIVEDFEMPFIHPMVTIQKWVEELKQIVRDELNTYTFDK